MTDAPGHPHGGIARYVKDPFPGLSHGLGALLGLAGGAVLLAKARDQAAVTVGIWVYGVSLVLLYTASFCAHAIHTTARGDDLLDRLDHAAIFGLIAGTYTPICLTTLYGPWGWTILSIVWSMALVGAVMVLRVGPRKIWVLLYLPMGWLVLAAVGPLLQRMELATLACLAIGGIIYSLGAIVFVTKRPRLWPGRFDSHDLWHVMVLVGSACHYAVIWQITAE